MNIIVQNKLKNPIYLKYIREHSVWYKILSRNPDMINEFEKVVKEEYKLRTTDKISKALSTIELVQNVLTTLK